MKKEKMKLDRTQKRPSRLVMVLVSILLVAVLTLNMVFIFVLSPYTGFINNFMSGKPETEEAIKATDDSEIMTQRIEEEGIVLLTNNGTLPLEANQKVNLFGSSIENFVYGGTGSGSGDSSSNVTLQEGLEYAGFEINQELLDFYSQNVEAGIEYDLIGSDFNIYELPLENYSDSLIEQAKSFSDTAIVTFSRGGGEAYDLPMDMKDYSGGEAGKSYLELQANELALLEMVKDNFENVIVILNAQNAMELGFLEEEGIDAAIWAGCPGSTGCNAIGNVIAGIVNPSGRTADTFPYEVESAPSYYSFGDYDFSNITYINTAMFAGSQPDAIIEEDPYHYVEYIEGIYVGYRYYETAGFDGFINYEETVQFPFGYGLSYTDFEKEIESFSDSNEQITMNIKVTNTGAASGKDVVEVYYTAPYEKGGIEKSHVVLAGYEKTTLLAPGESQIVTIEFKYEDMASYDYQGIKASGGAYVLEAGEYQISLQNNSHDVIDSKSVNITSDIIYNEENDGARESDLIVASNQFDEVSNGAGIVYVSRSDWEGTMPTTRALSTKEANNEQLAALRETIFEVEEVRDITFANHGLRLEDMKGLSYDDPKWDMLLEQLSINDMSLLIGNGGWCTLSVSSVGKPYLSECDGPNGVNNIMAGVTGNQYTGQSVLGLTWNKELASEMGSTFAKEAIAYGISGLYAPAVNIHRSPFSGRNYEYFSEDGYLSGTMAAAEIQGIQSEGVYCYTKHFAVNDQEMNRDKGGLSTWLNEQAMREIYLRGFEIAVKDGESMGIMSSFNRIGGTPAAENYALLTTVLRNEWGFVGAVVTDCVMAVSTQDINKALLAGNDLQLTLMGQGQFTEDTTDTPQGRQAMRLASHNILYMVANSGALDQVEHGIYGWLLGLIVVDILVLGLFVLYYANRYRKMKKWKAEKVKHAE